MKQFFNKGNPTNVVIGAVLFLVSFPFLLNMHKYVSGGSHSSVSPLAFPKFVMILVVVLSLVLVVTGLLEKPGKDGTRDQDGDPAKPAPGLPGAQAGKINHKNTLVYLGILFLYLAGLHFVGFMISTPIIMLMVAYILQGRNFLALVPGFIAFSVGLYYISMKLMKIILPAGILFE